MSKYIKAIELAAMYGCGNNALYMKAMKQKCGTRRVKCTLRKLVSYRQRFKVGVAA